jgi:hypothetical protein
VHDRVGAGLGRVGGGVAAAAGAGCERSGQRCGRKRRDKSFLSHCFPFDVF